MVPINQILLPALLLLSIAANAQKKEPVLYLKEGPVKTAYNITETSVEDFNSKALRHKDRTFAVLQFQTLPSADTRNYLAKQGIELLEYIPENAYTVSIAGKLNAGVLKRAGARTVIQLTPKQKMHPSMAKGDIPDWATKAGGMVDAWISFPKTYTAAEVVQYLKEKKIDVTSTKQQAYRVIAIRVAPGRLEEVAAFPFIEYVEPAPAEAEPLNMNSRNAARANVVNASVADGGKGLNGDGVVIGIGDNGDVQSHADLSGPRLINKVTAPAAIHGIHVHVTAAGAGIVDEYYRGYASKATVISQIMGGILQYTPDYVRDYGMVLTNNSYGGGSRCGYFGYYDLTSRILDQHSFDYPHLQHVFAAGNSGGGTCAPYPNGYHTVLNTYQAAKNVLTVGATEWNGDLYWGSSKGPVQDGRIKPEITAQGGAVISGTVNSGYGSFWGTSMASPAVTGGLALLYQRYRQLNGGANPKNGLMKALICNGAGDLGNAGPDYSYGFGWMNLARSVDVLDNHQYFIDNLTNGANNKHTITVPVNTAQLKVMLYWNDPPPSVLSGRALVNDLDLTVLDPALTGNLPKILDTSAAGMANVATSGADHLNNMEQVIIDNPAAGTYSLNISGAVAQNPSQEYYLVYDVVPVSTTLTNPVGGQGIAPGETVQINWDSYGAPANAFTLKYSTDNGATWTDINTNVSASARQFAWTVPNTPTKQALVRIERNGTAIAHTSQPFTILGVPSLSLTPEQCEGYISLAWPAVAGATDYEVMMKRGDEMVSVATATATAYTISGMSTDSTYWVSVRARLDGKPGRRATAVSRQPNNGTCAGTISDNDLKLDTFLSPVTGRRATSSELSATQAVTVRIKNLDDAPVTGFTAKYKVNNNTWVSESVGVTIPAGATYNHTFAPKEDFSGIGSYNFVAVVENNTPDPTKANDTLYTVVRHLDNQPISLTTPFLDDLEGASAGTFTKDTIGLSGIDRYDFSDNSTYGRLRTSVKKSTFSGTKSLILDAERSLNEPFPVVAVTGTYNLAGYASNVNDIRMDFKGYNPSGESAHNKVWVRGSDTQSWLEVYNYTNIGKLVRNLTPSIQVADTLAKYGQTFSSSFQVKWTFAARGALVDNFSGSGLVVDDISIYEAFNDMEMLSIDTPVNISCGLSGAVPLKVALRNSSNTTLTNVPVKYSLNGGNWVTETIPSIAANTTINYTFANGLNFAAPGLYTLKVLVDLPTDNYRLNDTLSTTVHNAPLVNTFPYLQNFEADNGGWYTLGTNSSWEYGTPASPRINKAASGTRAWKTNLDGLHNDEEYSFLYSPCFDLASMSNPTLSFSVALDLEDCGTTLCDAAWVEYSTDNRNWLKLIDTASAATNWYKRGQPPYWSIQDYTRWHVATMGLPKSAGVVRLRIVMRSDPAVTYEGIAIDDIHVYDSARAIYDGVSPSVTATRNVSGTEWVHFESDGKLVASIKPNGQNLGATDVQAFIHSGAVRNTNKQYYHNRNITIKPQITGLSDSVTVRMYFPDSESEALLSATGCTDCAKPASAYELGVSKYSDPDQSKENGEICDDSKANNWSFITNNNVAVVPFQKGYYIEFKVKDFSEFWLNNGGADLQTPLSSASTPALEDVCVDASPVVLSASPAGGTWSGTGVSGAAFDPSVAGPGTHTLAYNFVQGNGCAAVATTSITVNPLPVVTMPSLKAIGVDAAPLALSGALPAGGTWSGSGVSNGVFTPATAGVGTHTLTYTYTGPAGCSSQASTSITVNPIPVRLLTFTLEKSGFEDVRAKWTTAEETTILRYELELAKGEEASSAGQFAKIGEVAARRGNATVEQYSFMDTEPIKMGRRYYRLKLVAEDGSFTYSEVRVIEFPVVTWRIYPNPSSGKFYMNYLIGPAEQMEANVYDARGRLVKQYRKKGSGTMQRLEVDLSPSSFAPGVYMLQTVVNGRKEFYKLHKL